MNALQLAQVVVEKYTTRTDGVDNTEGKKSVTNRLWKFVTQFFDLWVTQDSQVVRRTDYKEYTYHCHCQVADEVIKDMDKDGYRPCTMFELLDFLATCSKYQRSWVVALGSIVNGHCAVFGVMGVGTWGGEVYYLDFFLKEYCRNFVTNADSCDPGEYNFLAVPKG